MTIWYYQIRFLTGQCSDAEIWYFIEKRNENDTNTFFWWKTTRKFQKYTYEVAFFTLNPSHWPLMCDMFQSWEIWKRYSWLNIVKGIHSYVLHQSYSEFWHTHSSVYSSIFRYIQAYSALLMHRHVQACWDIIKEYSGSLKHLQFNPRIPCNIFTTLPYSKPWHIMNRKHIQNSVNLWPGIFRNLS